MNDGAMNDGAMNDGAMNDGAMNDGATNDGATNDGATNDGALTRRLDPTLQPLAQVSRSLQPQAPITGAHDASPDHGRP